MAAAAAVSEAAAVESLVAAAATAAMVGGWVVMEEVAVVLVAMAAVADECPDKAHGEHVQNGVARAPRSTPRLPPLSTCPDLAISVAAQRLQGCCGPFSNRHKFARCARGARLADVLEVSTPANGVLQPEAVGASMHAGTRSGARVEVDRRGERARKPRGAEVIDRSIGALFLRRARVVACGDAGGALSAPLARSAARCMDTG